MPTQAMSEPTIIDVETDEVIIEPNDKPQHKSHQNTSKVTKAETNPTSPNSTDLFGMFGSRSGFNHASDWNSAAQFPGMSSTGSRRNKLVRTLISAFTKRGHLLRNKLLLPIWILLGLLAVVFIICLSIIGLIFSLLKVIFRPYIELFRRPQ